MDFRSISGPPSPESFDRRRWTLTVLALLTFFASVACLWGGSFDRRAILPATAYVAFGLWVWLLYLLALGTGWHPRYGLSGVMLSTMLNHRLLQSTQTHWTLANLLTLGLINPFAATIMGLAFRLYSRCDAARSAEPGGAFDDGRDAGPPIGREAD